MKKSEIFDNDPQLGMLESELAKARGMSTHNASARKEKRLAITKAEAAVKNRKKELRMEAKNLEQTALQEKPAYYNQQHRHQSELRFSGSF